MKILITFLLAGLISHAGPLLALESDDHSDWVRLDSTSLHPEWAEFYQQIHSRPWVEADFVERRFFSFRRGAVSLTGTVWFGRDEGLTLAYRMPREEMMRIDEKGISILRENKRTRSPKVPEKAREIPDVLLALFRFDLTELEKTFEVFGRREGDAWALRLVPHDLDESPIQRVDLEGTGLDVTRIEIEQQRSRRIELELSNLTYPSSLNSEELARRFP